MSNSIRFAKARGLNRSSEELATDLINAEHKTSYPVDKITFGIPKVVDATPGNPNDTDTLVGVSVDPQYDSRFSGEGDDGFLYHRIPLSELVPDDTVSFQAPASLPFKTHDILAQLNARLKAQLSPRDVINEEFTATPSLFRLKAHPNSLAWKGEIDVAYYAASGGTEGGGDTGGGGTPPNDGLNADFIFWAADAGYTPNPNFTF